MSPRYVILALVAFVATRTAFAAGVDDRKQAKERAAKKACLNGRTVEGIELLTDLYVDTNDPVYIFNQGRCYEQSNLCAEAIVRFREYLRKTPNESEHDRSDVAKHIADCEALLAKKASESSGHESPLGPPRSNEGSSAGEGPPARFAQPVESLGGSAQAKALPGANLRLAGVITMGAGGLMILAGVVLDLKHNSMIHDIQGDYNGNTADSAQTYKTISMVGYAAGAACLAGGAILYWMGYRAGKTAIVPAPVAGRTGVLLTGQF